MNYNFYGFNSSDFENLVQALFQKLLGNSSLVYGLGADGGRELSFRGKASFASQHQQQDGLWIVQAKFRNRDVHDHDQYDWVKTHFKSEMRKFRSGKYPVPDQYIFVTNAVLTPGYQRGGRDKMEELITHYQSVIPRIYVVAYDELTKLLLNNADVRQAYDHFLSPGDQMAQVRLLLAQQAINRPFVLEGLEIRNIPEKHNYTINLAPGSILTMDFGTSYSLCGVISQRGHVELVPTVGGGLLLNSVISFFKNGSYIIGNSTLGQVRSGEILTIAHLKRYLALGKHFEVFGKTYTAEELAVLVVRSLKTSAEEFFGVSFNKVVVAKPANYNLRQTKTLREIYEKAGLKVCRMLDEGTAPCYLFPKATVGKTFERDWGQFLIIDLGGGTFDLSVQEFGDGIYETKAVLGDNQLGGIDYDLAVLDLAAQKMKAKFPQLSNIDFYQFLPEAERVKKVLSNADPASFMIADQDAGDGNLADFSVVFSRDDFRRCTAPLNQKIMQCLNEIIRSGDQPNEKRKKLYDFDAVMLTGQGAKIFTVREIIDELYPNALIIDQYIENAVCMGNAFQAGVIEGIVKDELLLGVQSTGLAIRVQEAGVLDRDKKLTVAPMSPVSELNTVFCDLIKANRTVPCKGVVLAIATVRDAGQSHVVVPVFEMSNSSEHYEKLLELNIPVTSGPNDIRLTVDIDANHQINLFAHNGTTGFSEKYPIG